MNGLLNQDPIVYHAIAQGQRERLQKEAQKVRLLRNREANRIEPEPRVPAWEPKWQALAEKIAQTWAIVGQWLQTHTLQTSEKT